jgi:hypothetical protein
MAFHSYKITILLPVILFKCLKSNAQSQVLNEVRFWQSIPWTTEWITSIQNIKFSSYRYKNIRYTCIFQQDVIKISCKNIHEYNLFISPERKSTSNNQIGKKVHPNQTTMCFWQLLNFKQKDVSYMNFYCRLKVGAEI